MLSVVRGFSLAPRFARGYAATLKGRTTVDPSLDGRPEGVPLRVHRGGRALAVLCILFFASGAAGLTYQILWVRLLGLVFGVTVYAASAVLATFMAGLGLGSVAANRATRRAWHPLRVFAAIELSIAIAALASPALLHVVEAAYVRAAPVFVNSLPALTLLRLIFSAAVLLVPTTLMGATLPVVLKGAARLSPTLERHPAILYASNTAGAIAGALTCGFFGIGVLGIHKSFVIGASLNLFAATGAMLLSLWKRAAPVRDLVAHHETTSATDGSRDLQHLVLIAFFLSGLVSLGLEIAWFRVLTLFVTASTYAFTVMLAVVLAGLALGSGGIAPFVRRFDAARWAFRFAVLQAGASIATIWSMVVLAAAYGPIQRALTSRGYPDASIVPVSLLGIVAILPPTLLLGAAFPVGLQIWITGRPEHERAGDIGRLYAVNVCGAIVGSLVAGFLLLPRVGSRWTIVILSGSLIVAALVVLARAASRKRTWIGVTGVLALAWAAGVLVLEDPFSVVLDVRYPGQRLVWKSEGVQTTASIHTSQHGGYTLYLDGMHQANDSAGMVAYHRRLAHLPLAIHPQPHRALVIGLGGGATAGAAALHDGVSVDVVELSSTVVAAARRFSHINYDVLRRPNVHLRVDDARNYLLLTHERYDVITADIIQPHYAGAGNVYALEYFQLARRALADGGMMLQWIGNRGEPEYSLIMRTFLTAFPNATLWASGELMVGTTEPLRLDRNAFDRKLANGTLRAWYDSLGTGTFDQLLALYTGGPDEMRRYVGPGPLLTDDHPSMEFFRSLPRRFAAPDRTILRGDVRRHLVERSERVASSRR